MKPMDIAMQLLKMPQEAKDYATQIHEGQMYGEQPYMTHVEDVASGFDDPHLQRIAYLHDTVEDSETGIGEIHERFGEDVGHAVDALTRRQGEQYFDYINRVKEHPEATQVKLADLHSNLKNNPNESLARRYQKAIGILTNKSEPMNIAMRFFKNSIMKYDMYGEDTPQLAQALLDPPPLPEGVERRYESKESLFRLGARNPITDANSAVNAERAYMSNFFDAQYNTPNAGPSSPEWKAHAEWYNNHPYRQEMNRQWALGLHPQHMSRLNEAGKRDDLMHEGKNPETGRYNKKFDVPRSVEYNRRHPDTPLSNRPSQRFIDWLNNYGIEIDDYLAEQGIGHSEKARKRHAELREKHEVDVPYEERKRKRDEMLAERERRHKLRLERYTKREGESDDEYLERVSGPVGIHEAIKDARRRSELGEKTGWSSTGRPPPNARWVYNPEEDEISDDDTKDMFSRYNINDYGQLVLTKGDAMSKAWFSLLKERVSPEAKRHKLEYDKKYESTPERVKYREELNRERRRRGMYGDHSGKDISHTEGGKLTVESEHENRARHFKDRGTLRRIAKGMKEDIELLQNLLSGPMDEQDEKIANALERKIKEEDEEEEEPYIAHEFFI